MSKDVLEGVFGVESTLVWSFVMQILIQLFLLMGKTPQTLKAHVSIHPNTQYIAMTLEDKISSVHKPTLAWRFVRYPNVYSPNAHSVEKSLVPALAMKCNYYQMGWDSLRRSCIQTITELRKVAGRIVQNKSSTVWVSRTGSTTAPQHRGDHTTTTTRRRPACKIGGPVRGGHEPCQTPPNSCISMSLENGELHTLPASPPRVGHPPCLYV